MIASTVLHWPPLAPDADVEDAEDAEDAEVEFEFAEDVEFEFAEAVLGGPDAVSAPLSLPPSAGPGLQLAADFLLVAAVRGLVGVVPVQPGSIR